MKLRRKLTIDDSMTDAGDDLRGEESDESMIETFGDLVLLSSDFVLDCGLQKRVLSLEANCTGRLNGVQRLKMLAAIPVDSRTGSLSRDINDR